MANSVSTFDMYVLSAASDVGTPMGSRGLAGSSMAELQPHIIGEPRSEAEA